MRRMVREIHGALVAVSIAVLGLAPAALAQAVFVNEIHYDNASTDTGEKVEIAGPAGTDLSGWKIVRYNGSTPSAAVVYTSPAAMPAGSDTFPAGTTIPDLCGGFGVVVVTYLQDGLQNGSSDGLALVDDTGAVVQFLSYEGTITAASTAAGGPAAGMTSTNIGVSESGTVAGGSLRLTGTGTTYADFAWNGEAAPSSFGACNPGQTFVGGDVAPTVSQTLPANGATGVALDGSITVAFSENVTTSASAFQFSCGGTIAFTLGGGPQTYTLTPAAPLPGSTTCTVTVLAGGVTDQDVPFDTLAIDVAFSFTTEVAFGACSDGATLVHDVQGAGPTSALVGEVVVIEGIVVGAFQGAAGLSGFYVQEDEHQWDADPATSEGIFVFDGSLGVPVHIGDLVRVKGQVTEFGTGGATLTELSSVTDVLVCSSGYTFPPTVVGLPVADLAAWERYEGMAIEIAQPLRVTETFNLGSFGEVVLATDRLITPTNVVAPGAPAMALQNLNDRSRIILDDASNLARQNLDPGPYPEDGGLAAGDPDRTLRVGDRVETPVQGVLDQRFGSYRIQPTSAVEFNPPDNKRRKKPAEVGGRVRVASFNVLNYFTTLDTGDPVCGPTGGLDCRGANSAEEFTRQRDKIIRALTAMDADVVGLIELENNPTASIKNLLAGLNAATRPGRYSFVDTGTIGTDAIKVALIYQPAVVTPVGAFAVLDSALDPRAITTLNRPALAQTFERRGAGSVLQRFTVVVNHFKSKGSACATPQNPGELVDPDTGDGQGNCNLTRVSMAQALIDWLAQNPTGDPTPADRRRVLVIGDLNSYAREHPILALTDATFGLPGFPANPNATYTNLVSRFVGDTAYSYVFQGQSGYLDHALANRALLPLVTGLAEWHINADEPVALDYNLEWTGTIAKTPNQQAVLYAADPYRSSDHDPLVVGLNPLCGDLDDDGEVDHKDHNLFKKAMRDRQPWPRADFHGNGRVDDQDLVVFEQCAAAFKAVAR